MSEGRGKPDYSHAGREAARIKRRVLAIAANLAPECEELTEATERARNSRAKIAHLKGDALSTRGVRVHTEPRPSTMFVKAIGSVGSRIPAALRSCPHCGKAIGHKALKWAVVDLLESNPALLAADRVAFVRRLFPEDNPANMEAGQHGGLLRAVRAAAEKAAPHVRTAPPARPPAPGGPEGGVGAASAL